MAYEIDETHDPSLESWVESANDPQTDFPIQNLPWVVGTVPDEEAPGERWLVAGFAIGDSVLNLNHLAVLKIDDGGLLDPLRASPVEGLPLGVPREQRLRLRALASRLLNANEPLLRDSPARELALVPRDTITFGLDAVPNFTDFYASVHHATNVGSMFRPDNPLLPNYKWIPVGYHGRASSVVPSGTDIVRPLGQQAPSEEGAAPAFGPCTMLDYEMEMGVVVGLGNELGRPVSIGDAEDHILGLCLLNDWSARDIQKWEYQPLGPFLAKSFATTASPSIVTMEALAPFRSQRSERPAGDPQPLPHLDSDHDRAHGAIDITLEVYLQTEQMRQRGLSPHRLSRGNFKDMYWTIAQMLTHHASNGCNLQPGDLLGSGTVSGPTRGSRGCLLELTWDGDPWANPPVQASGKARTPIELPSGEKRMFLEDGDEVILRGFCEREGFRQIGFGECRGTVRGSPRM